MACATVHLAIAKKFLEKHPNLNSNDIINGSLYPDASNDDAKSHYTDPNRGSDNVSHVRGKVNLYQFLQEHKNMNDFELGWFLHLVTDYLFFEECFTTEYLETKSYEDFRDDLYYAYTHLNLYLSEKYGITDDDYKEYPSELYPGLPYEKCIISKEMIDEFIDRVCSINIEKYISKIKSVKKNIKP